MVRDKCTNLKALFRLMLDSREKKPLLYQPVKMQLYYASITCPFTIKRSFQKRENKPNSEKQEEKKEQLPNYLHVSGKCPWHCNAATYPLWCVDWR